MSDFEKLVDAVQRAAASYDYAQHMPKWDVEVINNRYRELEQARAALIAEYERVVKELKELKTVFNPTPTSEATVYVNILRQWPEDMQLKLGVHLLGDAYGGLKAERDKLADALINPATGQTWEWHFKELVKDLED